MRKGHGILLGLACGIGLITAAGAQPSVEQFYKGKQIRLIVSSEPGGGYDNYARLVARHLGNHIPGNPSVIVQNMPGAGGLNAANNIYNIAPKDGTVIGHVQRNVPFVAIQGLPGPRFDPTKFNWLSSLNNEVNVCVAWHTAKVKSVKDALTHELIVGGSGPNDTEVTPAVLNNILGTKFKIISGYPSSSAVTLAMERGEVEGLCSSYSSIENRNRNWITEKKINFLLQNSTQKHPDLPNVPLAMEFAKSDEDRQLMELNDARLIMGRPFMAPPEVPEDRVKALRAAFSAMVKDAGFMEDAQKQSMEITPVGGDEIQALLERVAKTPKNVIERLNDAQIYKGERGRAKSAEPEKKEPATAPAK
jgi:tripartite-type tricarboxylate transporter receptor subunit TctC